MAGKLILCSLLRSKPDGCDDYLAGVRSFNQRAAPGWTWCPLWEELGPPWPLLRQYLSWKRHGAWPRYWGDYAPQYRMWLQQPPAARALAEVARLLDQGRTVAVGCWCMHGEHCHRRLIGEALEEQGYAVEEIHP